MRPTRIVPIALGCLASLMIGPRVPAERAGQPADVLAVSAGSLLDVERGVLVANGLVLIKGDRIVQAGQAERIKVPEGARRVDLGNLTLLPGLIDAHVHLTLAGKAEENARATLLAGFTTVQDLGAIDYSNLALRDAIRDGRVTGPRVVASGPWLGTTGGICDFNGIGVRGPDAFRARVREDVKRGADLIKICVTGWLAAAYTSPSTYEIADDALRAGIEEAHALGRRVAVHALSAAGIETAVKQGADLVVHGGFTPGTLIPQMRKRGVRQLSTLWSLTQAGPPAAAAALEQHLTAATREGLPFAFGTDAGVVPHGANAREFERLTAIGLTPADAIRAATVYAAEAVGLQKKAGNLAAGAFADLIAVDGNPLTDVTALQRVKFVMKDGRVYLGPGGQARIERQVHPRIAG
jgi:imidazolonepropionase-like amidohydrolase